MTSAGPSLLKTRHLWLSRPDFAHGWTGVPDATADVVIFRFTHLPTDLQQRLPRDEPFFEMSLSDEQCRHIEALGKKGVRYWRQPLPGWMLYFDHALMNLSLLVFEALRQTEKEQPIPVQAQRVRDAIRYFSSHIASNPQLEEVARNTGISPAQLRRDFVTTCHMSPKKAFDDIRLKMALEYLQQADHKVEWVAQRCGYLSASAFSRAFKTKFGHSPRNFVPIESP